jgi:predicted Rdx family selenoprotein
MADPGTCVDCVPEPEPTQTPAPAASTSPAHNALDPSTFVAPAHPLPHSITIEFCNRCRWLHRASWTSTELMLTFPPPAIQSVALMPLDAEETGGRFRVWLYLPAEGGGAITPKLVWDRKIEGEPRHILKQIYAECYRRLS